MTSLDGSWGFPGRVTIGKTLDYCGQSCLIFPENLQKESGQVTSLVLLLQQKPLSYRKNIFCMFLQHSPQQRLVIAPRFGTFQIARSFTRIQDKGSFPFCAPTVFFVLPSCFNGTRFCDQFCIASKFNTLTLCLMGCSLPVKGRKPGHKSATVFVLTLLYHRITSLKWGPDQSPWPHPCISPKFDDEKSIL